MSSRRGYISQNHLVNGLIYYNKFNGISIDSSPNGISTTNPSTGTIWNYESSILGQGLNLSGNSLITASNSDIFSFTDNVSKDLPFSISVVIKNNIVNTEFNGICGKTGSGTSGVWEWYYIVVPDGRVSFAKRDKSLTSNSKVYTSTTTLTNGVSYHVIFKTDGINAWFIINGVKELATVTITGTGIYNFMGKGTRPLIIFNIGAANANRYFKGTLSQFAIWNRMLSDEEDAKIWNSGGLINLR